MNQIKIEQGVPISRKNAPVRPIGSGSKYQLHLFQVGDSAFYPIKVSSGNRIHSAVAAFSKRSGQSFTVRKTIENESHGHRVWRIS